MLKHFDVLLDDMLTWCKKKSDRLCVVIQCQTGLQSNNPAGGGKKQNCDGLSTHPGGIPAKMAILLVY